ncbi:MAG: hypothetical protein ACJ8HJ_13210 [Massilia sp.]
MVVNLTTRFERDGPAGKKKFPDSGHARDFDTCSTSTRLASNRLQSRFFRPVVDKLLNIHRIECAKLPRDATADFLSSFGPVQKQGLCKRFERT